MESLITLSEIQTKVKETKPLHLDDNEPLGLLLEEVKVRDKIMAMIGTRMVEVEILSQVPMVPFLFHVLLSPRSRRINDELKDGSRAAMMDTSLSTLWVDHKAYCINLISTILPQNNETQS